MQGVFNNTSKYMNVFLNNCKIGPQKNSYEGMSRPHRTMCCTIWDLLNFLNLDYAMVFKNTCEYMQILVIDGSKGK